MTKKPFAKWAKEIGLDGETCEQLFTFAATPKEMNRAIEAMEPCPPIYDLNSIHLMNDRDDFGVARIRNGFLFIGGCPNGDPIALDISNERGSVWYIGHETMHEGPLRSVAHKVAGSIQDFIDGICNIKGFPFDYYDAIQQ